MYKYIFNGREEDNALLTYCYLDSMAGLSYRVLCCAKLSEDGRVEFNMPGMMLSAMTMREGTLECPAEIINEGADGMERFQKEVDSIKENYGHLVDRVEIHEDIPLDEFRHPVYPDDVMASFYTKDGRLEKMWVREKQRIEEAFIEKGIIGVLLDEPINPLVGLHKGDTVPVIGYKMPDGQVEPVALLPWMRHKKQ